MNDPVVLSEEIRLELINAAGASERAGRPRMLVFLAALVLVAAVVYLAYAGAASASAASAREAAEQELVTLKKEADALLALDAQRKADEAKYRPVQVQPQLEALAVECGMIKPALQLTSEATGTAGLTRLRLTVSLDDQLTAPLFRWLARTPEIEGLYVTQIDLNPDSTLAPGVEEGQPRWRGQVYFVRYERR